MAGEFNPLEGVLEVPLANGKSIKLSRRVTNRIKARFEDWLELRARKSLFAIKRGLSVDEYRESLDSISRISATELKWGGPVMNEALQNLVGIVKFINLLAKAAFELQGNPLSEVTEGEILVMMQDPHDSEALVAAYKQVMEENRSVNFLSPPDRAAAEMES